MKKTDAYMTVEAALVVPVVLGVILFVITTWLFLYNRCLTEQNTAVLALRGSIDYHAQKEELLAFLEEQETALKKEHDLYLAWDMPAAKVSLEKNHVLVSRQGALRIGGKGKWSMISSRKNLRMDPVFFVRSCRKWKQSRSDDNKE